MSGVPDRLSVLKLADRGGSTVGARRHELFGCQNRIVGCCKSDVSIRHCRELMRGQPERCRSRAVLDGHRTATGCVSAQALQRYIRPGHGVSVAVLVGAALLRSVIWDTASWS
eukprot:507306-Rhodomonas_salina.3